MQTSVTEQLYFLQMEHDLAVIHTALKRRLAALEGLEEEHLELQLERALLALGCAIETAALLSGRA